MGFHFSLLAYTLGMHGLNLQFPGENNRPHGTLQRKNIFDVEVQAAQALCSISDLYYAFGPREMPFQNSNLMGAVRLFGIDMTAFLQVSASQFPFALESEILQKVTGTYTHTLYLLRKQGSLDTGWVCLIPHTRNTALQKILQKHNLLVTD